MELNFNKTDDLHATLTVALGKDDYTAAVERELKKTQKQIAIKGFRVGHAPIGMVKSMYGKSILVDEINKIASQKLFDYLKENNIDILAQPLPSASVKSDVDIENKQDFMFAFDLGLAPKFEFNITNQDVLDRYIITVDDAEVQKEIESLTVRFGEMENVDATEEKDIIYLDVTELEENNNPLEGGIANKNISFTPELVKNEDLKKQFIGLAKESTLTVNLLELFNDNQTVISSSLGIDKEAVAELKPNFKVTVTEISRRKPAEINQELFDKVMGEGVVTSIEDFKTKIKENLEAYYKGESDHHLEHMIGHLIDEKHTFSLPDEFLKRWLLNSKEEHYNAENINERYASEAKVLKEVLIREKAAQIFDIKVEMQDIEEASLGYTLSMFRNYGMQNPEYEFVKKFSDDSLKKREFVEQMNDIALRRKIYNQIKEIVSYNDKTVTIEQFYELLKEHNHQH